MPTIRTVIADDEPLARERLRTLLAADPDIDVVAECADGCETIQTVEALVPDLLFLDVQMPELDGVSVVEALDLDRLPVIVFVTAYDEYAVRAFELHALDYLLKPFDHQRFATTLQRAKAHFDRNNLDALRTQLTRLLEDRAPHGEHEDRLLIRQAGRVFFVPVDDIDWIESAGNYVRLHASSVTHLMRETLKEIERRLGKKRFARIHRSTLVNMDRVRELQTAFHGDAVAILRDGAELTVSRSYRAQLERQLSGRH